MSEVTYQPKPLQTRRGDLIIPPEDPRDRADVRRKRGALAPVKRSGWLARLFLVLLTVACFAAIFKSDVLWTDYDTMERSAYQSMTTWTEAWQLSTVRGNDPFSLSSYFFEQSIPLPTPVAHRAINLLLHIIAALLLLSCLEALKAPAAYSATLIFAVHPAVLQTIFWPGYRTEILGLILILAALNCGIRNQGTRGYLATLIFTALACLIHPAAIAIPVILGLIIIFQQKSIHIESFNRVLPLVCIVLFLAVWTQAGPAEASTHNVGETMESLHNAGKNMFFYIRQTLLPLTVGLFHPMEQTKGYRVGAGMSLLPFMFFIPFYILAAINFRKTWARATLLGLTAYLLLSLPGVSQTGHFLDGALAHEEHGLYLGLPAFIALLVCGAGQLSRNMGLAGKPMWTICFSIFLLIQVAITAPYAYSISQPITMWQSMSQQWPDSWIPKAALIHRLTAEEHELLSQEEKIVMLNSILQAQPQLIEERILLARLYRNEGQNNNALREYKRILRETTPSNEFLEEAARFYDKLGLTWDATNARQRIER